MVNLLLEGIQFKVHTHKISLQDKLDANISFSNRYQIDIFANYLCCLPESKIRDYF
ncbi:hypothetical protein [Candidatus Enterovibrio altilux]|uniref:Uncharacterized protein n=1 Tax=Candidatus Enterovibrio altilux TaxID=1927128 RepID=A0A291B9F6_9GAMM|nr:hypothetical protein [Candidatus Enterovibrio luxaltus]ATF09624.1 hypothetical protein BTN50_1131 [Candidatus Enterovibrio luxaltus]